MTHYMICNVVVMVLYCGDADLLSHIRPHSGPLVVLFVMMVQENDGSSDWM